MLQLVQSPFLRLAALSGSRTDVQGKVHQFNTWPLAARVIHYFSAFCRVMSDAFARFVASALGATIAETVTLPTDVVKVRLQVQQSGKYAGFLDCLLQTARQEGPTALWKGLAPALLRQISYTSLSLVIYEPIREFYVKALHGDAARGPSFVQRLAAGGTAGALAIAVFNPAEVIKTQVQTHTGSGLSMAVVARRVWEQDGIAGFWAGVRPNIARTFLVNAAELGTYDEAKSRLMPHFGDGLLSHVGASGIAGFTSACVSTPADVVKTRLMNCAGGEKQYRGMFHAFSRILFDEGVGALYKGFLPICIRKLVWCAAFFVSYERIRSALNARCPTPRRSVSFGGLASTGERRVMAAQPPAAPGGIQQIFERNQEATIYVGNLDPKIDEEVLWELMVQCGPVANLHLPRDKITTTHQGLWRVEAAAPEALAALSAAQRAHYDWDMSYLRNMSSVGAISSHLEYFHSRLVDKAEVAVPLRRDNVQLWSWRRLTREMGFNGCEVLVLDTEGCDVEILRSMAYHCGSADKEQDTHMVLGAKAVEGSPLHHWMLTWRCSYCGRRESYPYLDDPYTGYTSCSNCRERPSRAGYRWYGFVEFKNEEDADYAIKIMNMIRLFGKPIRCNKSSQDKKTNEVGANLFIGNLEPEVDEKRWDVEAKSWKADALRHLLCLRGFALRQGHERPGHRRVARLRIHFLRHLRGVGRGACRNERAVLVQPTNQRLLCIQERDEGREARLCGRATDRCEPAEGGPWQPATTWGRGPAAGHAGATWNALGSRRPRCVSREIGAGDHSGEVAGQA
eukprot:s2867_g3.t3